MLDNFRAFWYLNQKQLGDMLQDRDAYLALTKTINNLGMINKCLGKHNASCQYFKQILGLETVINKSLKGRILDLQQEMLYNDQQKQSELEVLESELVSNCIDMGSSLVNLCSVYSDI